MAEPAYNEVIVYAVSLFIYFLHSPLSLLHIGRYRLVYAIIFGAMSTVFLDLVLGDLGLCSSGSKAGVAFCNKGKHFQIATVDGITHDVA